MDQRLCTGFVRLVPSVFFFAIMMLFTAPVRAETTTEWSITPTAQLGGWRNDVAVEGSIAALAEGPSVTLHDISGDTPQKLSTLALPVEPTMIAMGGNRLYGISAWHWNPGLFIVADISDPVNPVVVGSCEAESPRGAMVARGDYVYYSHDGGAGQPSGIRVVDVTDPENPVALGNLDLGENITVRTFTISGNFLYGQGARGTGRLFFVYDLSEPLEPELIGETSVGNSESSDGLSIAGTLVYSAIGWSGVRVVDVSDPGDPSPRALFPVAIGGSNRSTTNDVHVSDNRLYVASSDGVAVYDVSDPENAELLGTTLSSTIPHIDGDADNVVALTSGDSALHVIRMSNGTPTHVSATMSPTIPNFVFAAGDRLYIGSDAAVWVYDATNPYNPALLGRDTRWRNFHSKALQDELLIGIYNSPGSPDPDRFGIVDVSEPEIQEIYTLELDGVIRDAAVSGTKAYLLGEESGSGAIIIDFSNPATPTQAGTIDFPSSGPYSQQAIAASDNIVCIAGITDDGPRIHVFDLQGSGSPQFKAELIPSGTARLRLWLHGATLFISSDNDDFQNYTNYVEVYNLEDPTNPQQAGYRQTDGVVRDLTILSTEDDDPIILLAKPWGSVHTYGYSIGSGTLYDGPVCPSPNSVQVSVSQTPNSSGSYTVITSDDSFGAYIQEITRESRICCPNTSAGPTPASKDSGVDTGDPIMAASGKFYFSVPLLNLGGPLPLFYRLDYFMGGRGEFYKTGMFGPFQSNLNPYIYKYPENDQDSDLYVLLRNGKNPRFTADPVSGQWELEDESPIRYKLIETGQSPDEGFYYLLDPVNEHLYIFEKTRHIQTASHTGRIIALMDRNDNRVDFTYLHKTLPRPDRVEDGLGRRLDFTYKPAGFSWPLLESVTDQGGRKVRFGYNLNPGQCNNNVVMLESVTDPEGHATTFNYACPGEDWNFYRSVGEVVRPLGNVPYSQNVDVRVLDGEESVRVTSQTDAYGNAMTLGYDPAGNRVTETRPDEVGVVYEHYHNHGVPKSITDPTGQTIAIGQTSNEQINQVTDRLGDTTGITYHAETGLLLSYTNAKGQSINRIYTPREQTFTNPANAEEVTFTFYNLSRVDYPDGTFETFTHDPRGNVLTHTDRSGRTWTFTYNERGQVLTMTNPAEGVDTFTYNDDGTLKTSTDTDTDVTTYGYDEYKRLNRVTYPGGAFVQIAYDLNDRITAMTDENEHQTRFEYDANGNLVKITDPEDQETLFEYDLMDRLVKTTDRVSRESTRSYDVMSRLAEIRDATGVTTSFGYDPRGWRNQTTRAGRAWTTAYDDEGVPVSFTTPLSRTVEQLTDKLGWAQQITDGAGGETVFARDAMNRVTAVTDPNNLTTAYSYDDLGRLAGITLPTDESATYAYNALGLLDRITDLNNRLWGFTYSSMGRMQSMTDPLNRSTGYAYDNGGRLDAITFPDAGTLNITRDPAGNVTRRQYSDGPDLAYSFDANNRLLATGGLTLVRDAEGRIVSTADSDTAFSASYDDAGRLATVGYNNDAFTVTYTYDTGEDGTGLLTGVSESLTGTTVTFGYDDDDRLRTVTLPNDETITYTWDNADRLTRLQSGNHVDLALALDAAGRITDIEHTAPLNSDGHLEAETESLTFDAALQISTAGYAHDPRGRVTATPRNAFTWDGASRLTGINDTALTYNGLGDIRTRTRVVETTRFHHNRAFGLTCIVAEQDETTGDFLRHYIHTPGGRLLYMIDAFEGNKVYFYHFNQVGSTLALTDMNGEVTDAWVYDPYGRVLARAGANPQPFTFVGAWGVRQEGDGGLYQMRARYYDANTGRFLSPEPLWPQIGEPKALNPYQYAGADPVRFIDPGGLRAGNVNDLLNQADKLLGDHDRATDFGLHVEIFKAGLEGEIEDIEAEQADDLAFVEGFNEFMGSAEKAAEAFGADLDQVRQAALERLNDVLQAIPERRVKIGIARARLEEARQQAEQHRELLQQFFDDNREAIIKILYRIRDQIAKEEQHVKELERALWKMRHQRANKAMVDRAKQIDQTNDLIENLNRLESGLSLYAPRD